MIDVDTYSRAVYQYNVFLDDIESYLDCVVTEADQDVSANFPRVAYDSVREISADAITDVDELRAQIVRGRMSLE